MLDAIGLEELADLIASHAVVLPVSAAQLVGWPKARREQAVEAMQGLGGLGLEAVVAALRLAARARRAEAVARPAPELVWAAHGQGHARSTTAVANELIGRSEREVIALTYSWGGVDGVNPVFEALRGRLLARKALRVRLVLGRIAKHGDARLWTALRAEALSTFDWYWKGAPHPELYMPAAGPGGQGARLVHAKVIVRDQEEVLLTSANLNHQAFTANVEAGVHLRDAVFARQIAVEVDGLVQAGVVVRVR